MKTVVGVNELKARYNKIIKELELESCIPPKEVNKQQYINKVERIIQSNLGDLIGR